MSPRLSQQVRQQAVENLALEPKQQARLEAMLSTYAELLIDLENLKHQVDIESMAIGHFLEEMGTDKAVSDEFTAFWTRGADNPRLDKQKLIAQGVTLAQIEAATTHTPKKDFFQIRRKSAKESAQGA